MFRPVLLIKCGLLYYLKLCMLLSLLFLILKHVFLSYLDSKKEFLGGHGVSLARVLRQN